MCYFIDQVNMYVYFIIFTSVTITMESVSILFYIGTVDCRVLIRLLIDTHAYLCSCGNMVGPNILSITTVTLLNVYKYYTRCFAAAAKRQ